SLASALMDYESKQSLPTSGTDNSELGTEALTRLLGKVLEGVFEARVKEMEETL
ncbi:hypothetical protein J1N35_005707, partial [Gossypium stocksii]